MKLNFRLDSKNPPRRAPHLKKNARTTHLTAARLLTHVHGTVYTVDRTL